ncbi:MAG: endo-1,4-beta-xylanase [Pseudomonadota bacterium]
MNHIIQFFGISLLATALTACGGGGSGKHKSSSSASSRAPSSSALSSIAPSSTAASSTPTSSSVAASLSVALKTLTTIPIGVAVSATTESYNIFDSTAQQRVVTHHFNQLTAGNIMKMSYLHPLENSFTYTNADALIDFASDNGMSVHGHALIWHSDYQVPSWMKNYVGDKTVWLAMLENHVKTITAYYSGKVVSWDVVNEAINDDGSYRNSIFFQKTDDDYIEQAFINAHEGDPIADLYYNDYSIEVDPEKMATLKTMLDDFIARDVPIDGVGFQMHIYMDYPSIATIKAAFQEIVVRDLKVKITELDIPINNPYSSGYPGNVKTTLTTELALAQKKRYCEVVAAYLETVPTNLRGGVTIWGVNDPSSWLISFLFDDEHDDWPLLFNANYNEKPALQGVADALSNQPCN